MKNTKAVFLVVLGSLILVTGFAFAGNHSLDQAGNPSLWKGDGRSKIVLPKLNITANKEVAATTPVVAPPTPPTPPVPVVVPPAPKPPTFGEKVTKLISDNKSQIVTSAFVGFLGFLILGTGGAALVVGLIALVFFTLNKKF
ncbi:MAG: hypothetical protein Q7R35_02370 [Elusimicrobiota bacterium]|nr:hypothetical protein [Elusimicrobiota bacterium]